jgi:hypothetical protein
MFAFLKKNIPTAAICGVTAIGACPHSLVGVGGPRGRGSKATKKDGLSIGWSCRINKKNCNA